MFIMSSALIKTNKISYVFHSHRKYFMVFLVMPQLLSCIFEISVMISTTIFPLIRARPEVSVALIKSLTIIAKLKMHHATLTQTMK